MHGADHYQVDKIEVKGQQETGTDMPGDTRGCKREDNDKEKKPEIPLDQSLIVSMQQPEQLKMQRPEPADEEKADKEGAKTQDHVPEIFKSSFIGVTLCLGPFDVDDQQGDGDGEYGVAEE